jgi:chemotaxis protein methyltransferase CheR
MTPPVTAGDLERFRCAIARRFGLHFDETKSGFLADLLRRRLELHGQACDVYLDSLESVQSAPEWRMLVGELTVAETYFFRNPDQFRALSQNALAARLAAQAPARCLRILAAGCASGEEAYSLAIALRERVAAPSWALSVTAVDANPAVLEKARRARYSSWSLRETPVDAQRRWFTREGNEFVLDETVRAAVDFQERNLTEDDPDLWRPGFYDIVFCRNVLMYLTPASAQAVVRRIARSLTPGGYLFLGHAETLRGLSQDFHLEHTHGTFYYRLRTASEPADRRIVPMPDGEGASESPVLPPLVDAADTWVEAIRRASDRIEALAGEPAHARRAGTVPALPAAARGWDLGGSLELLERERFGDALELVRALPAESSRDPDVLLLRAALLTHSGQLERAESECRTLLELDELSSGAHYLLALCREGAGDAHGAAEQDQVAAYLDPNFAMPRLHLGLLARRTADLAAARREFSQALVLLQREDASRLLLFGGGFGRDALIALCRTELVACGGAP